jgi:DNA (cytosine-5)-methyltransferase 1
MTAYYNEIDAAAAAVLRELITAGVIAPGDVDDRSIKDVQADDLRGYTQLHFFAGGGLWSVAARLAGWPDDRHLWTGSCPCQGESLAGKRLGANDPRHLWPDFYRLIRACRPSIIMGEQVAAAAGSHWLDRVCADLADENYAARAVDIPACAVDAPHQRNRLYWIAVDDSEGSAGGAGLCGGHSQRHWPVVADANGGDGLQSDTDRRGRHGRPEAPERGQEQRAATERTAGGLLADIAELQGQPSAGQQSLAELDARSLRNGSWWADAEWIVSPFDGKARRAKPGIPFLVDGLPGRVDLWRVGGNAISPILAAEVIAAYLETEMTSSAYKGR